MDDEDQAKPKDRRRIGVKDFLSITSVLLLAASVLWKGGELTGTLSTAVGTLSRIEQRMDAFDKQQASTTAEVRVLQERSLSQGERLMSHENRINRIESRPGRGTGERDG